MGLLRDFEISFQALMSTALNEVLGWEREAAAADEKLNRVIQGNILLRYSHNSMKYSFTSIFIQFKHNDKLGRLLLRQLNSRAVTV